MSDDTALRHALEAEASIESADSADRVRTTLRRRKTRRLAKISLTLAAPVLAAGVILSVITTPDEGITVASGDETGVRNQAEDGDSACIAPLTFEGSQYSLRSGTNYVPLPLGQLLGTADFEPLCEEGDAKVQVYMMEGVPADEAVMTPIAGNKRGFVYVTADVPVEALDPDLQTFLENLQRDPRGS